MTDNNDDLIAAVTALVENQGRILAHPRTRYLSKRVQAGTLTPDERAEVAALRTFLASAAELAVALRFLVADSEGAALARVMGATGEGRA